MNFLLDTNVVSEWVKPHPNHGVVKWLANVDENCVFISAITIAELRYGIERMPHGSRRRRLDNWVSKELITRFDERLLNIDTKIAQTWGCIIASMEFHGRSGTLMDACIAAIAKSHDLTLVTRNVKDFALLEIKLINPWTNT